MTTFLLENVCLLLVIGFGFSMLYMGCNVWTRGNLSIKADIIPSYRLDSDLLLALLLSHPRRQFRQLTILKINSLIVGYWLSRSLNTSKNAFRYGSIQIFFNLPIHELYQALINCYYVTLILLCHLSPTWLLSRPIVRTQCIVMFLIVWCSIIIEEIGVKIFVVADLREG